MAANRIPAREAMQQRTRVTFGKAYLRDLVAGVQRDFGKHLSLAVALGVASQAKARKMKPETLTAKLIEAVQQTPEKDLPRAAEFIAPILH